MHLCMNKMYVSLSIGEPINYKHGIIQSISILHLIHDDGDKFSTFT